MKKFLLLIPFLIAGCNDQDAKQVVDVATEAVKTADNICKGDGKISVISILGKDVTIGCSSEPKASEPAASK